MNSVVWEFWASISGLEPAEVFTLEQHQAEVFDQRVGESLYQAARRVIGPTGSVTELNAFFTPYVDYMDFNDLLAVFTDTGLRFYTSQRVTVRENLVTNPRMQTANNWVYAGNGGTANFLPSAAYGTRVDYISDLPSNNHILYQSTVMPINGGDTLSGSYEIEVPVGYPAATFQVRINSYGGATLSTVGPAVTVQPGQTATITTNPLTSSAENNGFRVILQTNGTMAAGSRFYVRNSLAEKAATAGPYFDGNTPVKIARNLAYNSSFEHSAGEVTVRENRIVNPGPAFSTGWGAIGATNSFTEGYLVGTVTADSTSSTIPRSQLVGVNGSTPVTPGEAYYLRMEVKHSRGLPMQVRPWFMTEDGTYVSYDIDSVAETFDWTPVECTGMVPATATRMGYQVIVSSNIAPSLAGDVYEARHITTDSGPYFDGNMTPDPDLRPMWVGPVNGSASRLMGSVPSRYTTPGNVARGIMSTRWKTTGEVSLRQIPVYVYRGSAYTEVATHASTLGLQPGKTYTVRADFYQEQPQNFGGSVSTFRSIVAATTPQFAQAPDVAGTSLVKLLFNVPTSGTWYLRLYNGGMLGDPDVWWDSFMIVEGDYDGPYFDGAIRPKGLASAWEGAEYLSPSYLYDPQYTVMWSGTMDNSTSLMVKYND